MRRNDIGEVERIAREIAKEEIAKALEKYFAPPAAPSGLKVEEPKATKKSAK